MLINTGSFLEYGVKNSPISENDISDPPELYSITKLAAEQYAKSIAKSNKKPIVTLRLFTPYGPYMQKGRLVYEIISKSIKNNEISLTSPTISRDLVYVKDIVSLYIVASQKAKEFSGEIFNAGSGKSTTIGELLGLVMKETKSKSKVEWGSHHGADYDSELWQADMSKTKKLLSWKPEYTLEDGIKETIKWFEHEK